MNSDKITKKYHTGGTFPKSNRKPLETGKIDTPYIQLRKLAWPVLKLLLDFRTPLPLSISRH